MNLMSVFAELTLDSTQYESGLKNASTSADNFKSSQTKLDNAVDDTTDEIKNQQKEVKNLDGVMDGISGTITKVTGLFTGMVAGVLGITASTQELREDLTKLETAFEVQGKSVEEAKNVYSDFYGIMGETDTAVEASNLLIQLTQDNEELAKWGNIAAGVMATFPDSLPIESLIEASNETAKVGSVTGALADALNWAGINEEKFNEQLQSLGSEQERVALITATLNGQYQEAGDLYKSNNADIIAQREAQMSLDEALADLGETFTPLLTKFTEFAAKVLPPLVDIVEKLIDNFNIWGPILAGIYTTLKLYTIITTITKALTAFKTVTGALTIAQALLNAVMLINPFVLIITAIVGLITWFSIMMATNEDFRNKFIEIFQSIGDFFVNLWNGIVEWFKSIPEAFNEAIDKLIEFFEKIPYYIGYMIAFVINLITEYYKFVWSIFTEHIPNAIETMIEWFKELPEKISKAISSTIDKIGDWFTSIFNTVKTKAPKVIDDIIEWFEKLPGEMLQIGKDIINGIGDGITNAATAVVDKVKDVAGSIADGFIKFFDINSPSKLMHDLIGLNIGYGISGGMEDAIYEEQASMQNALDDVFMGLNTDPSLDLSSNLMTNATYSGYDQPIVVQTVLDGEVVSENQTKITYKKDIQRMFA